MDISFPCLFYNCLSDSNSMAIWMYLFMTIYSVNSQSTTPPTAVSAPEFTNYRQLDYEGKYILGWKHNATDIEFEVTVQTPGYVGLGFSKTGEMRPSDMDYHVNETDRIPLMDDKPESDWVVLGGIEVNGTTVLRFSRKLDTCDPQDQVITKHDMNNRGVVNMNLLNDDVMLTSFPSDTYMIDATIGEFTIPAVGSTLQCRVFANGAIPAGNLIKAFHMPEGVGLPMAGLGYVLEIHYSKWQEMTDENGSPVTIPDGSGLRLTYTTSPVTHLAGMLELGRAISSGWSQLIPDKETAFTSTAYCSPKCMTWNDTLAVECTYDTSDRVGPTRVPEKDAMGYLQNATAWDADLRRRFKAALTMSDERSVCSSISRQPALFDNDL
ncbi:MOXD1-like protein [Mya arenaria]|uniref:MOXD1-like protein n=1 Tax=Mya arenaria TaxID=6604 RepID=A0ABY7GCH2_MYAAR|nr:MOXD1-like protein [Mya arenaria]